MDTKFKVYVKDLERVFEVEKIDFKNKLVILKKPYGNKEYTFNEIKILKSMNSLNREITLKYLDKLGDKVWEIKKKENLYRYDDRRIYLDSLLGDIDRIQNIIEKGKI